MADIINVRDLPEEDVRALQRWIERLRAGLRRKRTQEITAPKEDVVFATWPLGVKGKLTREEIYDCL